MYERVNESMFVDAFDRMDRSENFTRAGRRALFQYFEELDDNQHGDDHPGTELDVIAICCNFSEYADLDEFYRDFDAEEYPDLDAVRDETVVIEVGADGFIIGPL